MAPKDTLNRQASITKVQPFSSTPPLSEKVIFDVVNIVVG